MAHPREVKDIIVSLPKTSQDPDVSAGASTARLDMSIGSTRL